MRTLGLALLLAALPAAALAQLANGPVDGGGGGGGSPPGGAATELQYRGGASTFGAITGSSWNGSVLTIPDFQVGPMVCSVSGGVFTCADPTPSTGSTRFVVKAGAGQSGNPFEVQDAAGNPLFGVGDGPSSIELAAVDPSGIPSASAGAKWVFLDSTNSNALSTKDESGTVEAVDSGGGSSDLIYSCATSVDVATPGNTAATAATCVIPADTLEVGDFCRAHSSWTYTDDGDVTGTWQACMTLNGTTAADNVHSCAAAVNAVAAQIADSTFSIDSSTVAEWYGGLTRGTPVANWGGGTVDVIVGSSMDFNFRVATTGAGDTDDAVTFKFGSLQCWRSTP